jgi:hypothetical protein
MTDALGHEASAFVLAGVGFAASLTLALMVKETRIAPVVAETGSSP